MGLGGVRDFPASGTVASVVVGSPSPTEVQGISFVGYTEGASRGTHLWNLQN